MERINTFLKCHQGETAWIFGKGPSLDHFSFNDAGPLRICINESVKAVPNPTYYFAHDEQPIRNVAEDWPKGCKAILQQVRGELAVERGVPDELVFIYDKRYADNHIRDMSAEGLAEHAALYGNSGTVHCAIHFCRLIGASEVKLVGFDGGNGYAKLIDLPDNTTDEHDRIREASISLLEVMKLPYEFVQPAGVEA